MEGWQGIPNAEASQASGVNTEQTMSTDTDQRQGTGVVWHTGTENGAVSDTDTDTESEQFTEEELQAFCGNRLYRCDKLTDTKKTAMRCCFMVSRVRICILLSQIRCIRISTTM